MGVCGRTLKIPGTNQETHYLSNVLWGKHVILTAAHMVPISLASTKPWPSCSSPSLFHFAVQKSFFFGRDSVRCSSFCLWETGPVSLRQAKVSSPLDRVRLICFKRLRSAMRDHSNSAETKAGDTSLSDKETLKHCSTRQASTPGPVLETLKTLPPFSVILAPIRKQTSLSNVAI